jgi:type I restriction enzyme M protein
MDSRAIKSVWPIFDILRGAGVELQSYELAKILWMVLTSHKYVYPRGFIEGVMDKFPQQLPGLRNLPGRVKEDFLAQVEKLELGHLDDRELVLEVFVPLLDELEASSGKGIGWRYPSEVVSFALKATQQVGGGMLIIGLYPWEVSELSKGCALILKDGPLKDVAEDISKILHPNATVYAPHERPSEGGYHTVIAFPSFGTTGSRSFVPNQKGKISSTEEAIADGLAYVGYEGTVVVLGEPGFLFSGGAAQRARDFLVSHDLLEWVISLPSGLLLPYSSVGASLLVLNKAKLSVDLKKISFLEGKSFRIKTSKRTYKLDKDALNEIAFRHRADIDSILVTISQEKVLQWNAELTPGRYLFEKEYNPAEAGERILKLEEVIQEKSGIDYLDDYSMLPLVTPGDLKSKWRNAKLTDEDLPLLKSWGRADVLHETKAKIVEGEALLLIKHIGGQFSLKPTYMSFNNDIAVASAIDVFSVRKDKVDVNFLLQELSSDYVKRQLSLLVKGASLPCISDEDLMTVRLRIPASLQEQRARVKIALEAFDVTNYEIERLQKQLAQREQEIFEEFNIFKHNFGKPFRQFRSALSLLEKYLHRKSNSGEPINMSEQIGKHSTTLEQCLALLNNNLDDAFQVLQSTENATDLTHSELELKEVDLKSFVFNKVATLFQNDPEFEFDFVFAVGEWPLGDSLYDYIGKINEGALLNVFQNFIDNAKRHGFQKGHHNRMRLVVREFNAEYDKADRNTNTLIFSVQNNGTALPQNFTKDTFIMKGLSFGPQAGTGIGGYSIHRTIEKFGGDLWIDEPDMGYNVCFSFDIPYEFK